MYFVEGSVLQLSASCAEHTPVLRFQFFIVFLGFTKDYK